VSLEDQFAAKLRASVEVCHELGYHPTRFTQMLDSIGARATAAKLVVNGDMQTGFKELVSRGRPELTMESIMLQPEFTGLFTAAELAAARWRLEQAGVQISVSRQTNL
jgi:hypothetical protein